MKKENETIYIYICIYRRGNKYYEEYMIRWATSFQRLCWGHQLGRTSFRDDQWHQQRSGSSCLLRTDNVRLELPSRLLIHTAVMYASCDVAFKSDVTVTSAEHITKVKNECPEIRSQKNKKHFPSLRPSCHLRCEVMPAKNLANGCQWRL